MSRKNVIRLMLVVAVFFSCLLPERVIAGAMTNQDKMLRMPKYSLWGDVTLEYFNAKADYGGVKSSGSRFSQSYRLNFQSYIMSPRLMYYTITTELDVINGTGTSSGSAIGRTLGIETFFIPTKPLNFSLRALNTHGKDYDMLRYGFTVNYSRPGKGNNHGAYARMRDIPNNVNNNNNANKGNNSNGNVNYNVNTNDNSKSNSNNNSNINSRVNANVNANANANSNSNLAGTAKQGFFSDMYEILPLTYTLDADRMRLRQRGEESVWDNASLRAKGYFVNTSYFLTLDYENWARGGANSYKGMGGQLNTITSLNWSFFQEFENYAYYRKNDVKAYAFGSALRGTNKGWEYGITADYATATNSEKVNEFNFSVFLSRRGSYPFTYKGIEFTYSFGFGVAHVRKKYDLWAGSSISAHKRFGQNTDLNSALSVTGGALGTSVDFRTRISYLFRPRKGYTVNIEVDPQSNILRTQTLKPQVNGWDYSILTAYTFGATKTTGDRRGLGWGNSPVISAGTYSSNRTLISHRGDLSINVYLKLLTFASDVIVFYTNDGKSFSWNNSLYATVMRRVGVTLGSGIGVDMPKGGTRTTNYTVYNLIAYSPWRTALLRIDTRYGKTKPIDTTRLEVSPSLTWVWRRVYMDLSIQYIRLTGGGVTSTDRRAILRLTRPFRIL